MKFKNHLLKSKMWIKAYSRFLANHITFSYRCFILYTFSKTSAVNNVMPQNKLFRTTSLMIIQTLPTCAICRMWMVEICYYLYRF